ncbi:MAG: SepM family pheromone-processing serine protease [Acidimicrobiia bacterium]|nr:MAG: SepM family pheromone-processing serine protease [Acidimicrobiia bacterium]
MKGEATITQPAPGGAPTEPPGRTRKRGLKWPLVLSVLLIGVGIAIALAWPVKVPYYTLSPGPVYDTSDFIYVVDNPNEVDESQGELFFLTVSLQEANVFEWIAAQLSSKVDLSPRENIRPSGVSSEELQRTNLARMEQSKRDAQFVALTQLGYEPTLTGTGALVTETVPGSGAEGVLLANDVIVAVDGAVVAFSDDLLRGLADKEIGESAVLTVERPVEGADDPELIELEIVLGPHVDDPTRPMIGILLTDNEPIVEFPIEIDTDSQNIGGPSAGMMFTLEIINQLTEDDITDGMRIAGTGTIHRDGTVGPIGGVKQKVFGAIDAGATIVFIPAANYDDALIAAGDDITVVRVETIDDPLDYLNVDLVM